MGAKPTGKYICEACGNVQHSWSGKCLVCGEWNSIVEQDIIINAAPKSPAHGKVLSPVKIQKNFDQTRRSRYSTAIHDVDNVLGGGLVPGGVFLIAGQPGIGKSTLLLQIAANLSADNDSLYVSGEESTEQISMRAQRLALDSSKLNLAATTSADDVLATIYSKKYQIIFVDSIQTMSLSTVSASAGSVSQITNTANLLMNAAKQTNTAIVIVGHVTKEGSIAGPKLLEHVVDTVMNLEGDRYGGFKVLRCVKNRFGSTGEVGIFEMKQLGLVEVANPSASLLAERQETDGSVVLATMEGSRPILVEVQALVSQTSYGYPKRASSGLDLNRLNLLIAMLQRRTKLNLSDKDVYINIVGGIKLSEPAADLAVCMAVGSAAKGLQLSQDSVVFGEVGLSGEVRKVNFIPQRIAEAKKIGFKHIIGPTAKTEEKSSYYEETRSVKEALNKFLKK